MDDGGKENNRRNFLRKVLIISGAGVGMAHGTAKKAHAASDRVYKNIMSSVKTDFNAQAAHPEIHPSAYVHPMASVIGRVSLGRRVMVSPCASIRGDEGSPIHIGNESNVQDCCVVHALETSENGKKISKNLFTVDGAEYAVYIGNKVSLAHQSQVHGPAVVGDDTFVGMQSLVFKAKVGRNCVIEPGAKVIGVTIPSGRYIPAGKVLTDQKAADALPRIEKGYSYKNTNRSVVHVNTSLADGYIGFGGKK